MTTGNNFAYGLTNQATGNYSGAWGGDQNIASGDYSAVVGGQLNLAEGLYSGVFGGNNNTAIDTVSTIIGGVGNIARNYGTIVGSHQSIIGNTTGTVGYNVILGGLNHFITDSPTYSGILAGWSNEIDGVGDYNAIVGGASNLINSTTNGNFIGGGSTNTITNGTNSSIISGLNSSIASVANCTAIGNAAVGDLANSLVQGAGSATPGYQQTYKINKVTTTTNNAQTVAYQVPVGSGSVVGFHIRICARRSDANSESGFYEIKGLISNDAGATALVAAIVNTTIAFVDAGWVVTAVANNSASTLDIKVTGETGKTIVWLTSIELFKVKAP